MSSKSQTGPGAPVHRVTLIPGDGIGKDVLAEAVRVLQHVEDRLGEFRLEIDSVRTSALGSQPLRARRNQHLQLWCDDLGQHLHDGFGRHLDGSAVDLVLEAGAGKCREMGAFIGTEPNARPAKKAQKPASESVPGKRGD